MNIKNEVVDHMLLPGRLAIPFFIFGHMAEVKGEHYLQRARLHDSGHISVA